MNRYLKIQTFCLFILVNCNLFSDNLVNEHDPLIIRSDNVLSDLHQRLEQIKKRQKVSKNRSLSRSLKSSWKKIWIELIISRNRHNCLTIPMNPIHTTAQNLDSPSLSSRSLKALLFLKRMKRFFKLLQLPRTSTHSVPLFQQH